MSVVTRCLFCGSTAGNRKGWCKNCEALIPKCKECGQRFAFGANENYCDACYAARTQLCPACGDRLPNLNVKSHHCYFVLADFWKQNTQPPYGGTFKENRFARTVGIESELAIEWGAFNVVHGQERLYSLHPEHTNRVTELVTVPLQGDGVLEGVDQLGEVFEAQEKYPIINDLTALHVHVGAVDFGPHDLVNLLKIYINWEAELYKYAAANYARPSSRYCVSLTRHRNLPSLLKCSSVQEFMLLWRRGLAFDTGKELAHRYWAINFDAWLRFRTIEFRMHEGTDDPERILNWTYLCLGIVELAKQYDQMVEKAKKFNLADLVLLDGERGAVGLNGDFFGKSGVIAPTTTFTPTKVRF